MAANDRFRLRFPFWLDLKKPDEEALANTIEHLKNERRFASTVRDGIRLIVDLRAGQVNVLFELFPWVAEALKPSLMSSALDQGDVLRRIEDLHELLVGQGYSASALPQQVSSKLKGLAPLAGAGRSFTLPTFDDDDSDTLILRRDTSTDAGQNFLNSMRGLQQ